MSEKDPVCYGNEPAFATPPTIHLNGDYIYGGNGLTKREYFAVVLQAGMLANPNSEGYIVDSVRAVAAADDLITELNK